MIAPQSTEWPKEVGKAVLTAFATAIGTAVGTWLVDELRGKFGTKKSPEHGKEETRS